MSCRLVGFPASPVGGQRPREDFEQLLVILREAGPGLDYVRGKAVYVAGMKCRRRVVLFHPVELADTNAQLGSNRGNLSGRDLIDALLPLVNVLWGTPKGTCELSLPDAESCSQGPYALTEWGHIRLGHSFNPF